jgi:D-alanyl-D-alanine carboxypeptidase
VDLARQAVVSFFKDEPAHFAPGERWEYCNSGSFLLGMIVERLSGKDYRAFLQEEFFSPLGLEHSAFDPHAATPAAVGHAVVAGQAAPAAGISWWNAFAGGGVTSTAHDLVQWDEALAHGKVVAAGSYAEMTRVQALNDGAPTGYGLCWYVREHHGHPVVFHTGTGPGHSAWLARYGADELTIAVLSNSEAVNAPAFGHALAMKILGVDLTPKDLPVPGADLRRCPGEYREGGGASDGFRIFAEGARLYGEREPGRASRLLCQAPGRYVLEADPNVSLAFEPAGTAGEDTLAAWCDTDVNIRIVRAARVK